MRFYRIRKRRLKLLVLFSIIFIISFFVVYWKTKNLNSFVESQSPTYIKDLCFVLDKNLLAVILVNSATTNVNRRQLIRSTWANKYLCRALKIAVVFIVGSSTDSAIERAVNEERIQFGDILKLNKVDSYHHLVEKIINGIKWTLTACPTTKYVLKIDDDVFLNIFALQNYLKGATNHQNATHFMCLLWSSIQVQRNSVSKWYVSTEEYPHFTYPPYCSGSAYIMPNKVAKSVCELYLSTPIFWIEDVYITGFLAKKGNLGHFQIGHFYRFVNYKYSDIVSGKIIFAHINKNETLIKNILWNRIMDFQRQQSNPLIVMTETYRIQNVSTDFYEYY